MKVSLIICLPSCTKILQRIVSMTRYYPEETWLKSTIQAVSPRLILYINKCSPSTGYISLPCFKVHPSGHKKMIYSWEFCTSPPWSPHTLQSWFKNVSLKKSISEDQKHHKIRSNWRNSNGGQHVEFREHSLITSWEFLSTYRPIGLCPQLYRPYQFMLGRSNREWSFSWSVIVVPAL